ncbi:hypothetical protein D9M71_332920 [compost metagenome]
MVVHFAVDLGAVQGVEQLVVARRHLQTDQQAAAQVFGPVGLDLVAHQQDRQELVPGQQLLDQFEHTALGAHFAQQDAQDVAAGIQGACQVAPVTAGTAQVLFPEKIQDHREIAAAIAIVVDQQNLGFTPHCLALASRAGRRIPRRMDRRCIPGEGTNRQLATSKVKNPCRVNFMACFFCASRRNG